VSEWRWLTTFSECYAIAMGEGPVLTRADGRPPDARLGSNFPKTIVGAGYLSYCTRDSTIRRT